MGRKPPFRFRADHFLLYRVREFCAERDLPSKKFIEEAVIEAIQEFEYRQRRTDNGYLNQWGFTFEKLDSDNERLDDADKLIGPFTKVSFDVAINRHLERKLALCEQRASSSR